MSTTAGSHKMNRFWLGLLCSMTVTLSQVTQVLIVHPTERISTLGNSVNFTCVASRITDLSSVRWRINGLQVMPSTFPDAEIISVRTVSILSLRNLSPQYNGSSVRCFNSSVSHPAKLLLQGRLQAVRDFQLTLENSSTILASWAAPFSLLPNDTTYCVDIYVFPQFLESSSCSIPETEFRYTLPPKDWCYSYHFDVTPVNDIGNGESIHQYYANERAPNLSTYIQLPPSIEMIMSDPVCTADLSLLDLDDHESPITVESTDLAINEHNITYSTKRGLASYHHYNVTLNASNIAGPAVSSFNISTHDVISAIVTEFGISTTYFEDSPASGALYSFAFITYLGGVDFNRSFLLSLDRNTSQNYTQPLDLYSGHYRVYVYDIEHDGTLSSGVRYPAVVVDKLLYNRNDSQGTNSPQPNNCTINFLAGLIWAQCTFSGDSPTGIQVIVQSKNTSEVHKLYVNQSMNLQTPVTVSVERDGEYQVSIFAIRGGILDSIVYYSETATAQNSTPRLGLDVITAGIVLVAAVLGIF